MVIFGTEAGGDGRALSLIHATRVLMIVTIAPAILSLGFGASLSAPIGAPAATFPLVEMLIMVVADRYWYRGGLCRDNIFEIEARCAGCYRVCRSAVGSGVGVYRSRCTEWFSVTDECISGICTWRSG